MNENDYWAFENEKYGVVVLCSNNNSSTTTTNNDDGGGERPQHIVPSFFHLLTSSNHGSLRVVNMNENYDWAFRAQLRMVLNE